MIAEDIIAALIFAGILHRRLVQPERPQVTATTEAREVIALALDQAAYGTQIIPDTPVASSEAMDDAEVALQALLDRPDLLRALTGTEENQ